MHRHTTVQPYQCTCTHTYTHMWMSTEQSKWGQSPQKPRLRKRNAQRHYSASSADGLLYTRLLSLKQTNFISLSEQGNNLQAFLSPHNCLFKVTKCLQSRDLNKWMQVASNRVCHWTAFLKGLSIHCLLCAKHCINYFAERWIMWDKCYHC